MKQTLYRSSVLLLCLKLLCAAPVARADAKKAAAEAADGELCCTACLQTLYGNYDSDVIGRPLVNAD